MLVVEGSDNLGKTVAIQGIISLATRTHKVALEYGHMGRPGPDFDFGYDYLPMIKPLVVQDRFHLGAAVWHRDVMPMTRLAVIHSWLVSRGGILVVMVAGDDRAYKRSLKDSDRNQLFSVTSLVRANSKYQKLAARFADFTFISTKQKQYPDEEDYMTWITTWFARKEYVEHVSS